MAKHEAWRTAFGQVILLVSSLAGRLQGKRRLAENCCYLLLAKALNHALAAYSLLQHGLVIDAALSARNGLETTLMLEVFTKDRSIDHFEAWSSGKRYAPRDVRAKLRTLTTVRLGDLVITVDPKVYDDFRFAYDWLCDITHANLKSSNHTARWANAGNLVVIVGGSLEGQDAFVRAIFKILSDSLFQVVLTCSAAFVPDLLTTESGRIDALASALKNAAKIDADA